MVSLPHSVRRGPVGIAAARPAAAQEVMSLLAADGAGVSHVAGLPPARGPLPPEADRLLAGFRALHDDPDTKLIVVAAGPLDAGDEAGVLAAVAGSTKPVVACLLGANPRAVSRSGAIRAARLDEAGRRAAAWARGWDQALVSSQLLDLDDELSATAASLAAAVGPGRAGLIAVFDDPIFYDEARLMLAATGARAGLDGADCVRPDAAGWQAALAAALADPSAAVVLAVLRVDAASPGDRIAALLAALRPAPGPAVVARVCCADPARQGHDEQRLTRASVAVAPGNAAAARLAALTLNHLRPA